jgi:hypothetical protein
MEIRQGQQQGHPQRRLIAIALMIAGGIGFSFFFACATPFAALATLAAVKMDRRETTAVMGLVWLANQAIGYGILGYPWTFHSLAWGLAIGVSGFLALVTAVALTSTRSAPLAISLPFIGAFAAYELSLYIAGLVLPDGDSGFTAKIVGQIFLTNLVALVGLFAGYQLAQATGLLSHEDAPTGMAPASR